VANSAALALLRTAHPGDGLDAETGLCREGPVMLLEELFPPDDADYPAGWGGKADGELLWAAPGNDQGSCASRTISFEAAEQAFVGLVGGVGVAG
jgi:hypothetical protein